ncbi:MAG: DUF4145 domain-containing protein, partial [Akkermansiaceae bacterium]|nr:DUF4145 domain-containing protein [Akkermansiaceae bacterium]
MSDFAKAKVAFALALAGLLFAIHPLMEDLGTAGFDFPGFVLHFRVIYYALFALLGGSVYFFAIDFLTLSQPGLAHRVGNLLYAVALLFPPVFVAIWLSAQIGEAVVLVSNSDAAGEISMVASSILAGAGAILIVYLISRVMNRRDREANVDKLAAREAPHFRRAEEMNDSGHYDLAALEAFRSIETALSRTLLDRNIRVKSARASELIPAAAQAGIIPHELVGLLHEVRVARNRAIHATTPIPDEDARWLLDTTRKILA